MTIRLSKGTTIPVSVSRSIIDASEPCKKDECMLSLGAHEALTKAYGRRNYHIKSTTNGMMFTLDSYRYTTAFPPATAKKIFNYDRIFTRSKDKNAARSSIRPFSTNVMIIEIHKIAPPASAERRKYQNEHQKNIYHQRKAAGLPYGRKTSARQISL